MPLATDHPRHEAAVNVSVTSVLVSGERAEGAFSSFIRSSGLPEVELLAVDSTKASCWVNNKLRAHEEQWKEDDCTFCQCVNSEPHCTAMACKQSCQNPVKIPGECCPFCEGMDCLLLLVPLHVLWSPRGREGTLSPRFCHGGCVRIFGATAFFVPL